MILCVLSSLCSIFFLIGNFELIIPKEAEKAEVKLGSEITIPCHLSAGVLFSDDVTDIKWFKETDLVCRYKNRQLIEGTGYENRVHLLTDEKINKGNVSLSIKDFKETDFGDYLCQVTCGDRTKEITIKVEGQYLWTVSSLHCCLSHTSLHDNIILRCCIFHWDNVYTNNFFRKGLRYIMM